MNQNKTLLVITSAFPNNLNIYEGIFVREQLLSLSKHFQKIYVIRPQYYVSPKIDVFNVFPKTWKEFPKRTNYKIGNIEVFFPRVSIFQPFKNKTIKKFIKNQNLSFDLIHSHFIYPSAEIGNYISKEFGSIHIAIGHGFDVYILPFKNVFWNLKIGSILKKTHKIISVSQNNMLCLEKLGMKNKSYLIYNGYNSDKFYYKSDDKKDLRQRLHYGAKSKIIISVGNLIPVKNHLHLIEQFAKLGDGYELIIVGEGYLRNELEEKIKTLSLKGKVHLLGSIKNEKLIDYFHISDAFVLPSVSESTGVAALEAGACGLPIVTYKNGGTEDYVSKEYSIVLENNQDLSEALVSITQNKFDNKKISEFYQRYSWDNIIKNNISHYL